MSTFSFCDSEIALRAFETVDAPALHAYLNDPALTGRRYVPDGFPDAAPLSVHQAEGVIDHWQKETESWTLAIVAVPSGELLGHARADWEWDPHSPSACVAVTPAHQRRGIGSAALAIALAFLFQETPAHVVSGWASSWNEPALSFMRRCGFHEAGRRPLGGVHAGVFYSDVAFDLLRPEWLALKEGRHVA